MLRPSLAQVRGVDDAQGEFASKTGASVASVDLQEVIEANGDHLVRSAYLLCGDETEAQDLVQETFLQALKSAHRFRGDSAVYTWLHGILRNLCCRHLRPQKRLVFEQKLVLKDPSRPPAANDCDRTFC